MAAHPTDRASLERDCDEEALRVGGPGGQHRNRRATGVRLRHRPTGLVVTATERRSRLRNREIAYARMAARLGAMQARPRPRRRTKPTAASRRRRLEAKRRRGATKARRGRVREED